MHSTNQILKFVFLMTTVVAVVLALMYTGLKGIHQENEATYNKRAILSAVSDHLDNDLLTMTDEEVAGVFDAQIEQVVLDMRGNTVSEADVVEIGYKGGKAEHVDMAKERKKSDDERILPLYIFNKTDGSQYYIVSVRGSGLWDEIWGNIALEKDISTIVGVAFDHKAETPGLGAEIKDNANWVQTFIGKKLFDADGNFISIDVVKGGAKDPDYEIDAITGATITADGVEEMMFRGIQYYLPYFDKIKS